MKTKLIVTIISTVVIALGGTVAGVTIANNPSYVASRAIAGFAEDFLERDEFEDVKKVLNGGSIQMALNGIEADGEDMFEGNSIEGKIYFSKDAISLTNVGVKFAEADLDFELDLYASKNEVYINDHVQGAYGVKYSTIVEEFSNSIFSPDANTAYSLDETTYERVNSILEAVENSESIKKDAKKLAKKVLKDAWEIIIDNAEISSENSDVRLQGERKNVRLVTITLTSSAMSAIVEDFYDYLCESKEISKFLDKYEDEIVAFVPSIKSQVEEYNTLSEMYEEMLDNMEEDIDNLCDETIEELETVTVKIATPKTSYGLLKLEVKYDKNTLIKIDCGEKGIKKTNLITINLGETEIEYNLKENDKETFDLSVTVKEYRQTYEATITVNKKRGNYKISLKDIYENYYGEEILKEYVVRGDVETKSDITNLTVNTATYNYTDDDYNFSNSYDLDLEIVVDTKDKMPARIGSYTMLSDITEKEFKNLISRYAF